LAPLPVQPDLWLRLLRAVPLLHRVQVRAQLVPRIPVTCPPDRADIAEVLETEVPVPAALLLLEAPVIPAAHLPAVPAV